MKSKNLENQDLVSVSCFILCMVTADINYSLVSLPHAANKPMNLMMRKQSPFLSELLAELVDCCWLDLAFRNGFLQNIQCACSRYCLVMRTLCTGALSSIRIKSGPTVPAYGHAPFSHQCAVFNDCMSVFP